MSAGLSRSMRSMRPVERAKMRTLLATAAATKSEEMLNCSDTRSMLNMGNEASSFMLLVLGGAYPPVSYAISGSLCGLRLCWCDIHVSHGNLQLVQLWRGGQARSVDVMESCASLEVRR